MSPPNKSSDEDARLAFASSMLQPSGIFLSGQAVRFADSFTPPFVTESETLVPQYRDSPGNHFREVGVEHEGASQKTETAERFFIVPYEVGVRLVPKEVLDNLEKNERVPEDAVVFELTAEFSAQYRFTKPDAPADTISAALKSFAQRNVAYHVWPYWRELIQSVCSRAGMPVIPLHHWRFRGEPRSQPAPKSSRKRNPTS